MAEYQKSAVAIGDLKNAALYFDHLVPVFTATEFIHKVEWSSFSEKVLGDLLPPALLLRPDFPEAFAEVNHKTFNLMAKFAIHQFSKQPQIKGLSQEEYDRVEDDAAQTYFSFVKQFHLSHWPLAADGEPATAEMLDDEGEQPLPLLTLSRLRVVDASKLPWEQIHEFRKDSEAQDRLRRLRLFAFQNYTGKTRDFVEDDLLARIYEYEASTRKWGLETAQGALSLVLNSKIAAGALAGSFVSALFGQPVAALIAGTAGAILEVGNVALELKKRQLAIESLARENPVSYVTYARRHVEGENAC